MLTEKDINEALEALNKIGISEAAVDQAAATILNSATKAVDEILKRRDELDKQGRENEPLIVLAGENHLLPASYIHHAAVLTKLKEQEEKTVLAMETTHNPFGRRVAKQLSNRDADRLKKQFNVLNYNTDALYSYSHEIFYYSPFGWNTLLHTCLEENIPVKYTDAAVKEKLLYNADPSTRQSTESIYGTPWKKMHVSSPEGLRVRNHHITKLATEFAANANARIMVQQCGAAHIIGKLGGPAGQGLATTFKKTGMPTVAYFLRHKDTFMSLLSPQDLINADEFIDIPDVPPYMADYQSEISGGTRTYTGRPTILGAHEKESAFVNAVLAKIGMGQYGLNTQDYIGLREKRKEQINEMIHGQTPNAYKAAI